MTEKNAKRRALLCVLEGIDGSGKSTLSNLLAERLRRHGLKVALIRQPTGFLSGISVRKIARSNPHARGLAAALFRDRINQRYKALRPAFQSTDVIICDRYFYSTVYQSRNIADLYSRLAVYARLLPIPDITFIFLPSALEARRRIIFSARRIDAFEQKISFFHRLYFSLRRRREVTLITQHLSLESLIELCATKILNRCSITRN